MQFYCVLYLKKYINKLNFITKSIVGLTQKQVKTMNIFNFSSANDPRRKTQTENLAA